MRRWLSLACAAFPLLGIAQDGAPVRESAEVRIANRTIIVLHGPIVGYHAKERADATLERIERVLDSVPSPEVSTEEAPDGTRVLLDGKPAILVTKVDIDAQAGETTAVAAREAANRLRNAILERREQESPRYLATALAFAALATAAFAILVWLLARLYGWSVRRLSAVAEAQSAKLRVSGVQVLRVERMVTMARSLAAFTFWVAGLVLAWVWLSYVLTRFPYTRPLGEQLRAHLLALVGQAGLAVVAALPGLLVVVLIFFVARAIVRTASLFFDRVEQGRVQVGWLDADTSRPTRRIFGFVVWVFALAMAYPYLPGAQTEAFKGLSVLVGLMVSLGAASVVGQAFAGLGLMYSRAIHVGDFVRVGTTEGTVVEIGMLITRIRTGLGSEVALPNTTIMSNATTNYSRAVKGAGYVLDTGVTIGYGTPWRQVHAMLLEAAGRIPDVARDPGPIVRQTALSDYYVEYRLIAYTPAEHPRARVEVLSDLHAAIQDVFNEYGVQILSPHYALDPKEPQVVPRERWYAAPARPEGGEAKRK